MRKILDKIGGPDDVKALDKKELGPLCDEIRQKLIDVVSHNGGHLASNLGTVEITVALHRIFNCPKDSIIFDVGHQCYTHKLLTGRAAEFDMLRQKGGIAGFPKPIESDCDPFIAGHSSTALSCATGLAKANSLTGNKSKIIAVVGDGAFAGGMTYEAISSLDSDMKNLIVVLNDNSMSISKSVGAVARYLMRLRTNVKYTRLKKVVQRILLKIPLIGRWLTQRVLRSKSSFRRFVYGGTLLEELGFNYIGAIDGHNIDEMCTIFSNVSEMDGPILVHAMTTKGKGYALAEQNPGAYHGVGQFDIEKGNPDISDADSFSNVFGRNLCALADADHRICGVTAAMKYATGMHYLAKNHSDRFFDVGIAEQHAVTFCAGLAKGGMKPVFSVYSTFLQRTFDQLFHDISLSKMPVTIAIDRAGFVGDDGETHQGILDVAMLTSIGTFTVASPCNYSELEYWTREMIELDAPSAIRYPRGNEDERIQNYGCTKKDFDIIKMKKGAKNLIITYGREFAEVVEAAQILNVNGKPCDILKLNIIAPVNDAAIKAAFKYRKIVFAEEGNVSGGAGEHFLHKLVENGFRGSIKLCGANNSAIAQATVEEQLRINGLDSDSLVKLFY